MAAGFCICRGPAADSRPVKDVSSPDIFCRAISATQIATRFIIAKLRNRCFFSLSELNAAIAELVTKINNRMSRHLGASRRALFEEMERPALKSLPAEPYVFAKTWQVIWLDECMRAHAAADDATLARLLDASIYRGGATFEAQWKERDRILWPA